MVRPAEAGSGSTREMEVKNYGIGGYGFALLPGGRLQGGLGQYRYRRLDKKAVLFLDLHIGFNHSQGFESQDARFIGMKGIGQTLGSGPGFGPSGKAVDNGFPRGYGNGTRLGQDRVAEGKGLDAAAFTVTQAYLERIAQHDAFIDFTDVPA